MLGRNGWEKYSQTAGMASIFPKRFCSNILTYPSHFHFGFWVKMSQNVLKIKLSERTEWLAEADCGKMRMDPAYFRIFQPKSLRLFFDLRPYLFLCGSSLLPHSVHSVNSVKNQAFGATITSILCLRNSFNISSGAAWSVTMVSITSSEQSREMDCRPSLV